MEIVIIGLSLTSSWGNGHATTYRSLIKGLHKRGHRVLFLEKDMPWYSRQRDIDEFPFCSFYLYKTETELYKKYEQNVKMADCVIVGSFVPGGVQTGHWVQKTAGGITAFYDIDTPVTLTKLRNKDYEYLSPDLIPGYNLYLSFTGGPVLDHIKEKYGSPNPLPLYCSVDREKYYPQTGTLKWDLGYMGTYSPDRQPGLEELLIKPSMHLPNRNFVIAGPQYPDINWTKNIKRIEHLSPDQHNSFYNSQRYTLNITRAEMKSAGFSPSVRIFEAAACATPIISDEWAGIETILSPGEEILIAHHYTEIIEILENVDENARKRIGENARIKVLEKHTGEHRAFELESYIESFKSGKPVLELKSTFPSETTSNKIT